MRKSFFFDYLMRDSQRSYEFLLQNGVEDQDYIGWNDYLLPDDFGDPEFEYQSIRQECAVCEISPFVKIRVGGPDAGRLLDYTFTRPVSRIAPMRATYTVMCNEDGSLKDDAIVYKFAEDDYLLLPSDIDHRPYLTGLAQDQGLEQLTVSEMGQDLVGLGIQGPRSADALRLMGFEGIEQLRPFDIREYQLATGTAIIGRVGFTADLGYECFFEPALSAEFQSRLESARSGLGSEIPGYGLAALEACRMEGGFIVAGWDCSTEVDPNPGFERSPLELGLSWLVNLEAMDFMGKAALQKQAEDGARFTLRYLRVSERVNLPQGTEIYTDESGLKQVIGTVNCSSWSWGLGETLGNASLKTDYANIESARVDVEGKTYSMQLASSPPVQLERRNQVPAATL